MTKQSVDWAEIKKHLEAEKGWVVQARTIWEKIRSNDPLSSEFKKLISNILRDEQRQVYRALHQDVHCFLYQYIVRIEASAKNLLSVQNKDSSTGEWLGWLSVNLFNAIRAVEIEQSRHNIFFSFTLRINEMHSRPSADKKYVLEDLSHEVHTIEERDFVHLKERSIYSAPDIFCINVFTQWQSEQKQDIRPQLKARVNNALEQVNNMPIQQRVANIVRTVGDALQNFALDYKFKVYHSTPKSITLVRDRSD